MKIQKGDKVMVISGKDKGKISTVLLSFPKENKIIVEGVNIAKKHVKPGKVSKEGGIIKKEAPINVSNVMFFDEKLNKPVRIGINVIKSKKYRINRVTKEVLKK